MNDQPPQFAVGEEVRVRERAATDLWQRGTVQAVEAQNAVHLHNDSRLHSKTCTGRFAYRLGTHPSGANPIYCDGVYDIAPYAADPTRWNQDVIADLGDLQIAVHDFNLGGDADEDGLRQFSASLTDGPEYDDRLDQRPREFSDCFWIEIHHPRGSAKVRLDHLILMAVEPRKS